MPPCYTIGMNAKRLIIATPHGFCSGVSRAVDAIQAAIQRYPAPIYCYNEVVHNRQVVDMLARQGVIFVKTLNEVPDNATLLFSAHGVAPVIREMAERKQIRVIDATCPFVARAHTKVQQLAARGFSILLIGHKTHEEVVGVAAEAPDHVTVIESEDEARTVQLPRANGVGVVTQTTLSVNFVDTMISLLRERFPHLEAPDTGDICYATQNRQQAVEALASLCDATLVLGSQNSSNSLRLAEIAKRHSKPAYLISQHADLASIDLSGTATLGLTSGASTPEFFLDAIVHALAQQGFTQITSLPGKQENIRSFSLPVFPQAP